MTVWALKAGATRSRLPSAANVPPSRLRLRAPAAAAKRATAAFLDFDPGSEHRTPLGSAAVSPLPAPADRRGLTTVVGTVPPVHLKRADPPSGSGGRPWPASIRHRRSAPVVSRAGRPYRTALRGGATRAAGDSNRCRCPRLPPAAVRCASAVHAASAVRSTRARSALCRAPRARRAAAPRAAPRSSCRPRSVPPAPAPPVPEPPFPAVPAAPAPPAPPMPPVPRILEDAWTKLYRLRFQTVVVCPVQDPPDICGDIPVVSGSCHSSRCC